MDIFVARQPIFNKHQEVIAYELLFRKDSNNMYNSFDADQATLSVINNVFFTIGMGELTSGKSAFINFTSTLLKKEVVFTLPKELVVVEILEDVEPDDEVIAACKKLKALGYTLALDDFVYHQKFEPLIDLVDIIKIDFKITQGHERRTIIEKIGSTRIKYLAEKVETREEYEYALSTGYSYFQGYFFSKPVILSGRDIPRNKLNHINLLEELNKPEIDFKKMENIIKKDVALSYKLLRFINSASFGFKIKIDSIEHALLLLGRDDSAKWIYMVALKDMGEDKPDELIVASVIRAKFGELIASKINMEKKSQDIFFMGILSMINTFTNLPMEEALKQIPIAEDVKSALLGEDNTFRDVYELIIAYESGNWNKFSKFAKKLKFDEDEAPKLYLDSLEWADGFAKDRVK